MLLARQAAVGLLLPMAFVAAASPRSAAAGESVGPGPVIAVPLARGGAVAAPGAGAGRERFHVLADGRVLAMVELQRAPAGTVWHDALRAAAAASPRGARAAAADASRRQLAAVEQDQLAVMAMLVTPDVGATVLYRVERAYDGIAVEVDPQRLDLLRGLPGVKAVHPLPVVALDNFSSVPLIGAPAVWDATGLDARGDGVTIGIIDTGIDYVHRDFGGSGSYAGQVYADNVVPWTAKVVGGWDFAGDQYDADGSGPAQTTPHPDGDPMDCFGHGTHVAGTAAGYGVTSAGATYTGPWGPTTNFTGLRIGPGVAPGAKLYALKIFGCSGTTGLTIQAIDWALDPNQDGDLSDHLDVINMSLGSPYSAPDDPLAAATNNAVQAGVVVACSAGNSGDSSYIVGAPAVASRAIAAASSVDSTSVSDGFTVSSPASVAGTYPCLQGEFGPRLSATGDITAALVYPSTNRNACNAFASTQAAQIAGRLALVDRGSCTFESKVKNCQDAGAIGVVVANNLPGDPIVMADDPTLNAVITIPSVFTTLTAGQALEAAALTQAVTATLTASLAGRVRIVDPTRVDTLSSFTSRGPRLDDNGLKPDLSAPGETIYSAAANTGSDGRSLSGTSMASPHVAGAAALIRQIHPDWTVEEVKAALMNTAWHGLFVGNSQLPPRYSPARVGAGRIDLAAAGGTEVVAFSADGTGQVGITFGAPEVIGRLVVDRSVEVVNHGSQSRTFDLTAAVVTAVPGVTVTFPGGATVTVPAQGSATVTVRLEADAGQLRHTLDPSEATTQSGQPRAWVTEETGLITLTPDPPPATLTAGWDGSLRVPFYAAPRPASVMTAALGQIVVGSGGSAQIPLTGSGVETPDAPPVGVESLAMPFELQVVDADEPVTNGIYNRFDIAYVGVASDAPARLALGGTLSDAIVGFAVVVRSNWSTPNDASFRIEIDTNRDGLTDYVLTSSSLGDVMGSDSNDVFVGELCPANGLGTCTWLPLAAISPSDLDIAPFNTSVIVLPVPVAALHLAPGASRFAYAVKTGPGGSYDATVSRTFDAAAPGLWFGSTPFPAVFADREGTVIPVSYDSAAYQQDGALGVLLLHLNNTSAQRAEVINVLTSGCSPSCSASVPAAGLSGVPVAFGATVAPGGCGGDAAVDWDFGDGTPHGTTASTSHTYASAGSYAWRLTVTIAGAVCRRTGVLDVSAAPPFRAVIGGVAHNAGAGASTWRTSLVIVNRSDAPVSVMATFNAADRSVTQAVPLSGGAAVAWSDVLEQLFGVGAAESTQGALVLSADRQLGVSARTYNVGADGTYGQSMPAVASAPLVTGQVGVVAGLAKSAGFRSNVGIVNLGSTDCTAQIRLWGAAGSLGSPVTIAAGPGGWSQSNDVFAAAGAPPADLAYALVEPQSAGCAVWAYGSLVDNGTDDPTTLAAVQVPTAGPSATASASTPGLVTHAVIPAATHNRGLAGSVWRTSLALVGAFGAPAATVTLTYVPTSGPSVTRTVTVTSFGIVAWQDVLADLFDVGTSSDTQGRVVLDSSLPVVVAARVYNVGPAGTFGQSVPALQAADGVGPGAPGLLARVVKNAAFRTNLGLVNVGAVDCDVRVTLHGADGGSLGSALTYHLSGGKWFQVTDVLAAAGVSNADLAYAVVETLTDGGSVWAYASVVDNGSNDPTTIALEP